MLVIMHVNSTEEQIEAVKNYIRAKELTPHVIPGQVRCAIGITGNKGPVEKGGLLALPGVVQAIAVTKSFKLISREVKAENTEVRVGDLVFGGRDFCTIAGPCSVETEDRVFEIADRLAEMGIKAFRGGAFKPRTSPYAFQGLGEEGLRLLEKVRTRTGMKIVSEAIDAETLAMVADTVDVVQIGARNMYNYSLLKLLGKINKPVLLKRGLSAKLEEFLLSAEYIVSNGNPNVILCERGIRTFSDYSRNTLDINVVPKLKEVTHLPIIVDPSHACGERSMVGPLARAGAAAGADGMIIEVHTNPDEAYSDGAQSLQPMLFKQILGQVEKIASFVR